MIKSFKSKETKELFERKCSRRFPPEIHQRAWLKLAILHAAERLNDLRVFPGNRLEKLSAARKGRHSIRINDQWRICFVWRGRDAYDVEVTDYH